MTDVVSSARNARENLARGLGALQSPGVPEHLMAAAEPIAKAMGNLHRIEASNGQAAPEAAPLALEAVRQALSLLQSSPITHPAVDAALEAVAGSLGLVHQLTQVTASGRPAAVPGYVAPAPAPAYVAPAPPQAQAFAATALAPAQPMMQPGAAFPGAPGQAPAPIFAPMGHAPMGNPLADTRQSAGVALPSADAGFAPASTMQSPGNAQQPAAAAAQQPMYGTAPTQPEAAALPPTGTGPRIEAALGAHSPTNFYKGLSGNDVVDAGGIFVATYQIPKMGTNIALHISLPGGYEFHAQAVVRWTREPSSVSDGSSPGFGAQFTSISQEGRQLVYRYVRNREPLFHDDF